MAHGENTATIVAAVIQAIPVLGAAGVAWVSLAGWRAQTQGQRHIEHAERALSRGIVVIDLIYGVRSPMFSMEQPEADSPDKRSVARHHAVQKRLEQAWAGWQSFAESYSLAGFYGGKPEVSVSELFMTTIFELRSASERVFMLEQLKSERGDPDFQQTRESLLIARRTLLGDRGGGMDEISTRMVTARQALEAQLGPVLRVGKKS